MSEGDHSIQSWYGVFFISLGIYKSNPRKKSKIINICYDLNFLDLRGLKCKQDVDLCREKIYACLDEHCRAHHPGDDGRFAQLLLRLPALRSISLKCLDHLFCFRLIGEKNLEIFIGEMFDTPL